MFSNDIQSKKLPNHTVVKRTIFGVPVRPLDNKNKENISNWLNLNEVLKTLSKQTIIDMMAYELDNLKRDQILDRLITRYIRLYAQDIKTEFNRIKQNW